MLKRARQSRRAEQRERRVMAWHSLARQDALTGYLLLLPFLSGIALFRFYGLAYNLWLSFRQAGAFGRPKFTGLENYAKLAGDDQLWMSLGNTLKFAAITVPGVMIMSVVLAWLMQHRFKGEGIFRAVVFLPAVCLPTAVILVFSWMFQTQYGIVNAAIKAMGGDPVSWLGSPAGVTTLVSLLVVYLSFSVPTIILYAGMQDISPELYEAAILDGASALKRFFGITLPMLSPSLFFVLITTTIGTLKLFDVVYVLLPPVDQSVSLNYGFTLVYYYFYTGFVAIGERGYAAAIALFILLVILLVSLVLLRLQRRLVHYGEDG